MTRIIIPSQPTTRTPIIPKLIAHDRVVRVHQQQPVPTRRVPSAPGLVGSVDATGFGVAFGECQMGETWALECRGGGGGRGGGMVYFYVHWCWIWIILG